MRSAGIITRLITKTARVGDGRDKRQPVRKSEGRRDRGFHRILGS